MKKATGQYVNKTIILDDHCIDEVGKEFKQFQPVAVSVTTLGPKKARSIPHLNLLFACLKEVARQEPVIKLKGLVLKVDTLDKAKFACKAGINFIDPNTVAVRPDGVVVFNYRSFAFGKLDHMESCEIFNQAYDWMADLLGCTVDELIAEAKSKMLSRGAKPEGKGEMR